MPADALLALLAAAIVLNLAVMAAIVVPPLMGRRSPLTGAATLVDESDAAALDRAALIGGLAGEASDTEPAAYDRVVRIVGWAFLVATASVIMASGLWHDRLVPIAILLALAAGFLLLVHDLLPPGTLGPAKYILEGSVAITFATFLVYLTGGHASPFFFTYPLIVGGAALVIRPQATAVLTAAAAVGYLLAAVVAGGTPTPVQLATTAIDLTALVLLAYIGSVIGREQRRARDAALRLSAIDSLTGLFNRSFFFAALDREIARSARSGRGFCLVMLDLDELKSTNDRHGHHVGDLALRSVAETIRGGVRRIDVAARYGGDEFVALLPETEASGGLVVAEKIRTGVAGRALAGVDVGLTVSVGVVSFPTDGATADALMVSADRAMYASKRGGKNRVAAPSVEADGGMAFRGPREGSSEPGV